MVSFSHTVVVCVDGGGDPDKHGDLKLVFQYCIKVEMTHTVVPCTHTVVVCVKGWGGGTP